MTNIIRKVLITNDVSITIHSYSVGNVVWTDMDLEFDGKSLLNHEVVSMNKEDLANFVQILIEAQNTESTE